MLSVDHPTGPQLNDVRKQLYRHLELSGQREKALQVFDTYFSGGKTVRGMSRSGSNALQVSPTVPAANHQSALVI